MACQINRSKVDLLKEVKQVQLQVLELQASLKKEGKVKTSCRCAVWLAKGHP